MLRRPRSLWDGLIFGAPCDGGQMIDLVRPDITPTTNGGGSVSSGAGVAARPSTQFPSAAPGICYEWPWRESLQLLTGGGITMSILHQKLAEPAVGARSRIFHVGSPTSTYIALMSANPAGVRAYESTTIAGTITSPGNAISVNTWYHVALIVTGSRALFYQRQLGNSNSLDTRNAITTLSSPWGAMPADACISIGGIPGGTTEPMYARVQNACVWSRPLDMGELFHAATWDFRS